jgi:hypothetical protein
LANQRHEAGLRGVDMLGGDASVEHDLDLPAERTLEHQATALQDNRMPGSNAPQCQRLLPRKTTPRSGSKCRPTAASREIASNPSFWPIGQVGERPVL